MSRVQADIEALKALRQALLTFASRQSDVLQSAESEIARTEAMLREAEQYWRRQVERCRVELEACIYRAMLAAQQGYSVDCSAYEYALQRAEEQLTRVIQWQARVQEAVAQYRTAAQRFASMLQNDLPRATSFLADRIAALEAYYASQVLAAATALAGAGIAGVMGGVIAAVRRSQGELARVMGSVGEQVAAQVLSEKFGLQEVPFDQPKHGFDRVFRAPGMPLVVMESKVSSSGALHLGQTKAGEQASPEWIAAEAAKMADRSSAQWSPANERIARLVQELGAENVPAVAAVVNPATGLSDVYTRQGTSDWQLLQGGIALDQISPTAPPEFKEGGWGGAERKG
ncbi:MAG: hypothetical protein ONB06_07270 [candidate division KSB1 bacterium]|nr:hypothetical protein [candidate division KSB1 bacterium]